MNFSNYLRRATQELFLHTDSLNLLRLREFTQQTLREIEISSTDRVLEIGPNRITGAKNSPVFKKYPKTFYDLRDRALLEGFDYSDLDIDPGVNPTFLGDIGNPLFSLPERGFNVVVCFSVLEHVFDIFTAVSSISKALEIGGKCHIITPWDLRFHGPRPDCWRISDDAYLRLLQPLFSNVEITQISNRRRPLSPVGLYVMATK